VLELSLQRLVICLSEGQATLHVLVNLFIQLVLGYHLGAYQVAFLLPEQDLLTILGGKDSRMKRQIK